MSQETIDSIIEGYENRGKLSKEMEGAYDWFIKSINK